VDEKNGGGGAAGCGHACNITVNGPRAAQHDSLPSSQPRCM
jgi:hypothetical protein